MTYLTIQHPHFFANLLEELKSIRDVLVKNIGTDDEEAIRPLAEAEFCLTVLRDIQTDLSKFFTQNPHLQDLFEKEYGLFRDFAFRDNIIDLIFTEDYLFPEKEYFPFVVDNKLDKELLSSYRMTFQDWMNVKGSEHAKAQDTIKTLGNLKEKHPVLPCFCSKCQADYRSRLRDLVFEESQQLVIDTAAKVQVALNENKSMDDVASLVQDMHSEWQKKLFNFRKRFKRATINKLEEQIKAMVKKHFGFESTLAGDYVKKVRPVLDEFIKKEGHSPELVDEQIFERFYRQLGSNLWRGPAFLEREFDKVIKSVLRLKRKDISSSILQEYLGQFWLHADARRLNRHIIYHMGPTNSGKTYHAIEALCKAKSGCYLAPLRLLAGELYDTMNAKGVVTTLLTGEEVIEKEGSTHYSSTIEMVRLKQTFDCAVIDEIQMVSDPQRGWAWTRALIGVNAPEIHICGDDTALSLIQEIIKLTGDTLEIKKYQRLTKLEVLDHPVSLGELEKGDALIVFSRKNALRYKGDLEKLGLKVSIVYGRLGPEVRREQARKFDEGETDVIVSTDAIAMGMNLPIKRIVFTALSKFIDDQEYELSDSEVKQIGGRAGRYLRFPLGQITCLSRASGGLERIKSALKVDLPQKTHAMVGPDLEIFTQVNSALTSHNLSLLKLSEFLRLFNTMNFQNPFFCVDLKEMIEISEMVEDANEKYQSLSSAEIFGFACAPVNLGLLEHVHYFIHILNHFIRAHPIDFEPVDGNSDNIDYLETSIKCIELYQWLARHFSNKNFSFEMNTLQENKGKGISKLNELLSDHIVPTCSSCGAKLDKESRFQICEKCFAKRRSNRFRPQRPTRSDHSPRSTKKSAHEGPHRRRK